MTKLLKWIKACTKIIGYIGSCFFLAWGIYLYVEYGSIYVLIGSGALFALILMSSSEKDEGL